VDNASAWWSGRDPQLRHTHATVLLEAGENPKVVVQERLGHTTFTTTMDIYSHVTPTMQRSAVDRFAAAVSGNE
jgi:integrase